MVEAESFPCSSNVYIFLKLAAERRVASGCLQAVITQLLLTQPKFPGQRGAQTQNAAGFCINTGNLCLCRSDPLSIFYEHVNSNYVGALQPHTDSVQQPTTSTPLRRVCACCLLRASPLAGLVEYTSHAHSVNQK